MPFQMKLLRQPFIALTEIFAPGSLVVTSAEINNSLKFWCIPVDGARHFFIWATECFAES